MAESSAKRRELRMKTFPPAFIYLKFLLLFLFLFLFAGCGDGQFPVLPAKGKIVCSGKPVTSGSVTFTLIGAAGKPAAAAVGEDGSFVLSTYGKFDGAIVGKHNVQFSVPEADRTENEELDEDEGDSKTVRRKAKKGPMNSTKSDCVQMGEITVEIKASGKNDFMIELSTSGK